MAQESNSQKMKTKWGVPVVIVLILIVIMEFLDMQTSADILFIGVYILIEYNIFYYRKTIKKPLMMLLLVQPFGLLGIVVLLPPHLYEIFIVPMFFFALGSIFVIMPLLYLLQERAKWNRCNKFTTARVIGNDKKLTSTTRIKALLSKKHFGASIAYSYSPTVQYYVGSELQEVTYGDGFPSPIPINTKVEILYNSENPKEFCFLNEKRMRWVKIVAIILLSLGLIAVLASVTFFLKQLLGF